MQNVRTAYKISDDDDAGDYENVNDNRKVPAVPERATKGNKTTSNRKDLQLKYVDKPANRKPVNRAEDTTHGPRTVPRFQPPPIGLDFSSAQVNAAFSDQSGLDFSSAQVNAAFSDQSVEQISLKRRKWGWKKTILILSLTLLFLLWIFLTSIMFMYYSNISNQLTELQMNASQIQDSISKERKVWTEKEREAWKQELMKINQTLVNEIAVLKSDIQSVKKALGLCTSCPAEWILLGSSCYFFSTTHQSWENSRRACSKMDSSLLILRSMKELDAIRQQIGNKRFWIGLKRTGNNWLWVDGTSPMFTNWNPGEPNNAGQREHCTEMITGRWNDLDCSNTIDFICQKSTTC